jgi:hypothetical protein
MCTDSFDDCSAFRTELRRARKRQTCHECLVDILSGQQYARSAWVGDDGWESSNRCAICYFLCEAVETLICGDHGQIPWGGGWLREELREIGVLDMSRIDPECLQFVWAADAFRTAEDRIFEAHG